VPLGPLAIPGGQTQQGDRRLLVTGRITAIAVDPTDANTLYAATALGGVWKTGDGGRRWAPKSDREISFAIGALLLDPADPRTVYAGTGEGNFSGDSYYGNGVLKSVDGGDTWTTLGEETFTGGRFSRLAAAPAPAGGPSTLFAATINGLFRCSDGGATWEAMTNGTPAAPAAATDVAIDPTRPATVYAAFWPGGIFKSDDADTANPTWRRLAGGLPADGFTRTALGLSPSSPQTLFALIANTPASTPPYAIDRLFTSADGGATWTPIALPAGGLGGQGFYNLNVAVDPTTPNIVYLGAISLWKATRDPASGAWTLADIGHGLHSDNHALAFDPTHHLVIYAGNDGGIYTSEDGGASWSDAMNHGLSITQFEFIDQHPESDAVVFGGTQDNGTEQYRNSPVFCHADDGDGGCCVIDASQPANVLSTYFGASPKRSTAGGGFGSWLDVKAGLAGNSLFYPPLTLDATNSRNAALGTDRINLDSAQGTGSWPTKVSLPGIRGSVSAINYCNSNLIYAGTTTGQVYRLTRGGGGGSGGSGGGASAWAAVQIGAPPLPPAWIWDIGVRPDGPDILVVVMSGFGHSHVWRGAVSAGGGTAAWTDAGGATPNATLPDIPVNSLAIDGNAPDTYYIGSDIGVFRTTDAGASWETFSDGLPACAIFDLRLHNPSRLLRAATHGRGLWERRLDVAAMPAVDLFFRDHPMDGGRFSPSISGVAAAFDDPLRHVALGDLLSWWQCADIKVDALEGTSPAFQMPVASVDYVAFESRLLHRNPQPGNVNRVYVQVANRGFAPGAAVTVKLLYAVAAVGLPPLPSDFWSAFPGNAAGPTAWVPIGAAQVVAALPPTEPVVLEWDWKTPPGAGEHFALLAVMDCPASPIPAASKVFAVDQLVQNERHAGLLSLGVVDSSAGVAAVPLLDLAGPSAGAPGAAQSLHLLPRALAGWGVAVALPKSAGAPTFKGLAARKPSASVLRRLAAVLGPALASYDTGRLLHLDPAAGEGAILELRPPAGGLRPALVLTPPARSAKAARLVVMQQEGGRVVGGKTFVLR
jgi:photosystem II stability/assembly factor-like uncharacterized protein